MEIWKEIEGYEGYLISNLARVKSTKRKKWNGYAFQETQEKILSCKKQPNNYIQVGLCKNGICKTFSLHRLVALHFIDNPDNLPNVGHKDHNPSNCIADNLYWTTQYDNIHYSIEAGRFTKGEKVKNSKLTVTQVLEVRKRIKNKEISQGKLAKELGVTQNCISEIVNRKTWQHVPDEENK